MASTSKTPRPPITWRDTADGVHGIVTHGLDTPHYVDISKNGRWALLTLDANDQPVFVTKGSRRNVAKAKQAAETVVRALVGNEPLPAATTKTTDAPAWVRVVKIYLGLSLLVLAGLIFARWLLFYRPFWLARIVLWGGSSTFFAHRLIVFTTNTAKRLDYLTGKRTTTPTTVQQKPNQIPMKLPALPSNKRKALPSGSKR